MDKLGKRSLFVGCPKERPFSNYHNFYADVKLSYYISEVNMLQTNVASITKTKSLQIANHLKILFPECTSIHF